MLIVTNNNKNMKGDDERIIIISCHMFLRDVSSADRCCTTKQLKIFE
jgi:hypothetical protein